MSYTAIPIEDYKRWIIIRSDTPLRHLKEDVRYACFEKENAIVENLGGSPDTNAFEVIGAYPELNGLPVFDVPIEWIAVEYVRVKNENRQYRFTEEQLKDAILSAPSSDIIDKHGSFDCWFDYYIQSLTKPKQYSVEIEQDCTLVGLGLEETCKPKITENKIKITSWKEI